jgi:2-polyprenyl-6-methoxyphenol hydroxylase-like FAD-dependent oxidoreductase
MSDQRYHPVIIIGGGIIGLTLAQALRQRSIPYLIYERDANVDFRGPGWALSIHWAKAILEQLLPVSVFNELPNAFVNPEAVHNGEKGAFVHYNALTAEKLFRVPPSERLRLRRQSFRQVLLSGIDVEWSRKFSSFTKNEDGTIVAHFEDGTRSPSGAVIVGCDGAHSKVRRALLPDASGNHQLPVRCLGVTVILPSSIAKPMRDLDPYFMQMGDQKQNVFVFFSFLDVPGSNHRADPDSYACQIFMSWPENALQDMPTNPPDQIAFMKHVTEDWAEPFHSIIKAIPEDTISISVPLEDWAPRPWDNHNGAVTLAGDAAHTMTMYRGEGFNQGLADLKGLVLSLEQLYKPEADWLKQREMVIGPYEDQMRKRTLPAVLASRRACLDAHDQQRLNSGRSPLLAMRAMSLEDLEGLE